MYHIILGWPKSSFGFFCNILQKNPNELFGQPNINILPYIKLTSIKFFINSEDSGNGSLWGEIVQCMISDQY